MVWRVDVEAEDPGRPLGRQEQRRQDLDERRLAGAVGPEQPEELAGLDLEIDAVEGDDGRRLDVVDAADAAHVDGERLGIRRRTVGAAAGAGARRARRSGLGGRGRTGHGTPRWDGWEDRGVYARPAEWRRAS